MDSAKQAYLLQCIAGLKTAVGTAATGFGIASFDLKDPARTEYAQMRQVLLSDQELAPVLPAFLKECHTLDDFWSLAHTQIPHGIHREAQRRDWVRQQFLPVLDALENDRIPATAEAEGQRFFAPGTQHDGFVAIRERVSVTKQSLFIADNFVDKTLWPLLTNVQSGSTIRILTKKVSADFGTEASNFAKQYGFNVKVRITDEIHDRFLVVDGQCWHLGASIKDFGVRAALISEVTSSPISVAVWEALEKTVCIWMSRFRFNA